MPEQMFSRLNLAAENCQRLTIVCHPKLSAATGEQIMRASHSHVGEGAQSFAFYGSTYLAGGVPHVLEGHVWRHGETYHVEFRYLQEKRSRPPRGIKPVRRLAQFLLNENQGVAFDCDATFSFGLAEGWELTLALPIPLEGGKADAPYTHLEAIRVSKRRGDEIQLWVQIRKTKNGDASLVVFMRAWATMSAETPQKLLRAAARLAGGFVRREKESSNGP